ncbi:MAG: glycosyltransferase, partial [Clostridia bacterium]|nr:glycosyltransferase [Clostridia bacterium]
MGNEKVSILMGIYNCGDTLSAAIDSILAQTYTDWELIMCDDASTDNT